MKRFLMLWEKAMSKMEKLIDAKTEEHLKAKFAAELKMPVDIKVFSSENIINPEKPETAEINQFAKQLADELHSLDPRILVGHFDMKGQIAIDMKLTTSPSILIGYDEGYKIIYNGAPLGQEASGFIDTICTVSSGKSGLSADSVALLAKVEKPVLLQVFVTPTCPYCTKSVVLANQIAMESKGLITAECVESMENQELAKKYNVSSVPQQIINADIKSVTIGTQQEKVFVLQALQYGAPEKYAQIVKTEEELKSTREILVDKPTGPIYLSDNNFEAALKKYENLIVDFWAEWCMPCKMLAPALEQLAIENIGKIVVGKINVDENQKTAGAYGIMSIPAVHYFKNGVKAGETVGVEPKDKLQEAAKNFFKL
jgi:thioredoxin